MNATFRRTALAAVLGLVLSTALAACGGGDSSGSPATTTASTTQPPATTEGTTTTTTTTTTTKAPRVIRITVKGGRPVGGIQRPSVEKGDRVAIVVTSDVADEIHLHGYDLMTDATPGKPARITFTASVPGRFEIELEQRGVQIADLQVSP